jgi:hypothetical protein
MKALDDHESIAKQSEYTLVLLGLKASSKDTKTEESIGCEVTYERVIGHRT